MKLGLFSFDTFFRTAKMRSVEMRAHEVLNKAKAGAEVDLKGLPLFKVGELGFFAGGYRIGAERESAYQ